MQIITNEPGRVIGYHGRSWLSSTIGTKYLITAIQKIFYITINVNDYVEHRAEVLQSYAQKLATRALSKMGKPNRPDPMSNSERKIIHRMRL